MLGQGQVCRSLGLQAEGKGPEGGAVRPADGRVQGQAREGAEGVRRGPSGRDESLQPRLAAQDRIVQQGDLENAGGSQEQTRKADGTHCPI